MSLTIFRFPMYRILIVFLLGCSFYSYSQTHELDSLRENLELFSSEDSTRAQLLLDYAIKMRRHNPNSSEEWYHAAIDLASKLKVVSVNNKALNGLAIAHGMQGEYSQSIESFTNALEFATAIGNIELIGDANNGLGIVYKRLGDYPQSLVYYSEALKHYDSINAKSGKASTLENIGILYDLMHEPEKSMDYYQRTIQVYKEMDRPFSILATKANIAVLYIAQKRYDEALQIFIDNIRSYDSLGRIAEGIAPRINAGFVLIRMKRFAEADKILKNAYESAVETEMQQEQADILNNLFEIAIETGNPKQALSFALQYDKIAQTLGAKKYLSTSYEIQSQAYEKNGDFRNALAAFKNHKAWSDSVFSEDKERAFNAQEVKVEVLEKNKQLAEQNLRMEYLQERVAQETRLKWMMAVISVLLLALGILFYQKFSERKKVSEVLAAKNDKISRQKAEIEEMNYQLENRMLRAQINPHFIFNSLSSIQHFITANEKPSALKYLSKFSHLLRQVLESSITGNVLMKAELELLRMYLELEALRFDNGFNFRIHVDEELDVEMIEIPTMILQPLVENAVLHGLIPKKENRELTVSFKHHEKTLQIDVEDNGIGRIASTELRKNSTRQSPSRGLSVTEQRLKSLQEKHGWQSQIYYTDLTNKDGTSAGTRVTIILPILENSI